MIEKDAAGATLPHLDTAFKKAPTHSNHLLAGDFSSGVL